MSFILVSFICISSVCNALSGFHLFAFLFFVVSLKNINFAVKAASGSCLIVFIRTFTRVRAYLLIILG